MSGPALSRFTPSLMSHELLERVFVARGRVLDEIMRRIEAAGSSTERHHTLLVGRRGAGKTHAVSLVYHRTRALIDEGRRLQIAWLPEDPWTIVSYRHLLTEIARRLEPAIDGDLPRSAQDLEVLLHALAASGGPIVVIAENLDVILRSIDDDGQQRLRHVLQSDRSLVLVATSTTLDRALSDRSSPFYGFFTTTRLEPFDVDEAAAMLTAIAVERRDDELVDYLAGDEGRARLRTIEHLAGGQPRMWAALASALTVKGLDELVDLLLTRFDDLTPYYQEQLARLSGHQRLVVSQLAEADRPMTVKELAERLEIDQRSLGKTVNELVDKRWVVETSSSVTALLDRRRTYYELAEPMARLSFQIKDNRGEPLRVIVDFLKHWFDPEELAQIGLVASTQEITDLMGSYVRAAAAAQTGDPVVAATRHLSGLPNTAGSTTPILIEADDALAALSQGSPEQFLHLPAAVRGALEGRLRGEAIGAVRLRVHEAALSDLDVGVTPEAAAWVDRASTLLAMADSIRLECQSGLLRWLAKAGRHIEARGLKAAMDEPSTAIEAWYVLRGLADFSHALSAVGEFGEAIALVDEAQILLNREDLEHDVIQRVRTELRAVRDAFEEVLRVVASSDDQIALGETLAKNLPGTLALCRVVVQNLVDIGELSAARSLQVRIVDASDDHWSPGHPQSLAAREALSLMGT